MTWRDGVLGDLVELQRGHDLPETARKPGAVPVVGSAGPNGFHDTAKAKGPGVTVGRSGASIGKVTYVGEDYWPHNTCLYVKDFKGNHPRFVAYFLSRQNLAQLNSGAAQPSLNRNFVYGVSARFPGPNEQAEIASILSAYDDLIENNRRRVALLEEAALQLYKEWFVRFRFPGHEHVPLVEGVPGGWEKKPLREILTLNYGKALKADDRVEGEFPVYGSSGVVGSHNKALVKAPGIIVGRKGNVGAIHWSHLDYHPIDTVYFVDAADSDYFVYHALLNTRFLNTDVAVPGLNRDFAYSREINIPTDDLREAFEAEAAPIYKQVQVLQAHNVSLAKARDLLLPKLMSGEIVI